MDAADENSIRNSLEWLIVDPYGRVQARIGGMSMLMARQAAGSLFPEWGIRTRAVGRLSATREQLAAADNLPLITRESLHKAGITPRVKPHALIMTKYRNTPVRQAELRANKVKSWAEKLKAHFPRAHAAEGDAGAQ